MHSSRMRTARSSSRVGGSPPDTPLGTRHLEADPSEQTSPGLGTPPGPGTPSGADSPPRSRHPPDQAPPGSRLPPEQAPRREQALPPVDRITDACENITLPQLRCGW